jgi:hypothetical protein
MSFQSFPLGSASLHHRTAKRSSTDFRMDLRGVLGSVRADSDSGRGVKRLEGSGTLHPRRAGRSGPDRRECLSIARTSRADVAGLIPRDASIAAGLADRADFATRLGGWRREVRSAYAEGLQGPALRVGRGKHGVQ